jgi:hypothetical protein
MDYEKAFDSVQSHILFDILKSRNIPDTLLKAIVEIHKQNKISIKFNSRPSNLDEINRVCKDCPLSPTLFNICLDEILAKWQNEHMTRIPLSKNKLLTLLFADDQVIISNTEDNLQRAAHKLNQIITIWFNCICTENKINDI